MPSNTKMVEKITTARILLSGMNVHDSSKKAIVDLAKDELELPLSTYSDNQLVEKIVKAKMHLEDLYFSHSCMIDIDPDYTGPCTCGASKNDVSLDKVKKALNLS